MRCFCCDRHYGENRRKCPYCGTPRYDRSRYGKEPTAWQGHFGRHNPDGQDDDGLMDYARTREDQG